MNLPESDQDLAAPIEAAASCGREKLVSFDLGGRLCCVAASSVEEVVQPRAVTPLPNSPFWLLGLATYRGEPVAVIDPSAASGRPPVAGRGRAKLIVFRQRPNEGRFALPVDALYQMISDAHSASAELIEHNNLFDGLALAAVPAA